jgi:hypothetical protein
MKTSLRRERCDNIPEIHVKVYFKFERFMKRATWTSRNQRVLKIAQRMTASIFPLIEESHR